MSGEKEVENARPISGLETGDASGTISLRAEDFKTFDFHGSKFRAIAENGEPLFVANDVCHVLGYENPWKAVGDHCKHLTKREVLTTTGRKEANFIPESDLYRLIFRSKKPEAEAFADFVYEKVLPTIRKTGSYTVNKDTVYSTKTQAVAERVVSIAKAISRLETAAHACGAVIDPIVCRLPDGYTLTKEPAQPKAAPRLTKVAEEILSYLLTRESAEIPLDSIRNELGISKYGLSVALNGRKDRKQPGLCVAYPEAIILERGKSSSGKYTCKYIIWNAEKFHRLEAI